MTAGRGITRAVSLVLVGLALAIAAGEAPALAAGPTVTIDKPLAGAWTNNRSPLFKGKTDDPVHEVTLKIYAGAIGAEPPLFETPTLPVGEDWEATPLSPLADGQYAAVAEQTNGSFEIGNSAEVTFTVDTIPPTMSMLPLPSPGRDSTPTLRGAAGVAAGDHNDVVVTIHGDTVEGPVALAPHEVTSGSEWSYTTPHLVDGVYTAQAVQSDQAGNSHSELIKFTIDTVAPKVEITTPAAAILGTSTPTFGGLAGQAEGDLGLVTLKIFVGTVGAFGEMLTQVEVASVGGSWNTSLAGVPLPDGIYTAVAEQSDAAGNVGKSRVTFAISAPASPPAGPVPAAASPSRSAPVASFQWFPSTPHVGEPVSLVSTSTDLSSPINAVAWDLAGSGAFAGGSSIVTTSFSTPGAHVVQLRVTDANGLSSVVAHTITVAAARPSLIQPFPVVRIAGSEGSAGVRISLLTVQTPAGARVRVACRGHGCPSKRVQVLAAARGRGGGAGVVLIEFRRFERSLRAGAYLEIRVSTPTEIGKYTRFTVRRGRLPARVDMCLAPAGVKPIACPSS